MKTPPDSAEVVVLTHWLASWVGRETCNVTSAASFEGQKSGQEEKKVCYY